jgi:hypothetical protein
MHIENNHLKQSKLKLETEYELIISDNDSLKKEFEIFKQSTTNE